MGWKRGARRRFFAAPFTTARPRVVARERPFRYPCVTPTLSLVAIGKFGARFLWHGRMSSRPEPLCDNQSAASSRHSPPNAGKSASICNADEMGHSRTSSASERLSASQRPRVPRGTAGSPPPDDACAKNGGSLVCPRRSRQESSRHIADLQKSRELCNSGMGVRSKSGTMGYACDTLALRSRFWRTRYATHD